MTPIRFSTAEELHEVFNHFGQTPPSSIFYLKNHCITHDGGKLQVDAIYSDTHTISFDDFMAMNKGSIEGFIRGETVYVKNEVSDDWVLATYLATIDGILVPYIVHRCKNLDKILPEAYRFIKKIKA